MHGVLRLLVLCDCPEGEAHATQEEQLQGNDARAARSAAWQHIEAMVQGAASLTRYRGLHAALKLLANQVIILSIVWCPVWPLRKLAMLLAGIRCKICNRAVNEWYHYQGLLLPGALLP